MAKKNETWTPSKSEIEFLRIFVDKADEATAAVEAKFMQVALGLGVTEKDWTSGAVVFDNTGQVFKRKETP